MALVREWGQVYCLVHGVIHEATGDPYDMGTPECSSIDWRLVYWRTRRGDEEDRGR